jgi:hypothetical protein
MANLGISSDASGGGEGYEVLLETIFCRSSTLCLTRFRISKLLEHPKQKPRREGGLRQVNTCHKVL